MEQRYRSEFRFTSNGYRNRFRYRLGFSYAFGKERQEYKPFQVSASNEIFFTNKEPYFERNRFLLAFNYNCSKSTTIQISNPTNGELTIGNLNLEKIGIYDISGKEIKVFAPTTQIDLSDVSKGFYLIKLFSEGKIITDKIVIK